MHELRRMDCFHLTERALGEIINVAMVKKNCSIDFKFTDECYTPRERAIGR